jgi:ribosomal protein S18 acetylase RimI-like enzyme
LSAENSSGLWFVEFTEFPDMVVAKIFDGVTPVGKAIVTINENTAHLANIKIQDRVPTGATWFERLLGKSRFRSYQNQGFGTQLLSELLVRLQKRGVIKLEGHMSGDLPRLTTWYRSLGFEVNESSGTIVKDIG